MPLLRLIVQAEPSPNRVQVSRPFASLASLAIRTCFFRDPASCTQAGLYQTRREMMSLL